MTLERGEKSLGGKGDDQEDEHRSEKRTTAVSPLRQMDSDLRKMGAETEWGGSTL